MADDFKIGDKVYNHCTEERSVILGVDPEDDECYILDDGDHYHKIWLEPAQDKVAND